MVESSPTPTDSTTPWIALPGLFAADEIAEIHDLDVRVCPLVQQGNVVFYGVYVRERCTACTPARARNAA